MKKAIRILALALILSSGAMLTSSCGTPFPLGCIYTNVWMPGAVGNGKIQYNRRGYASCYCFLGWVAGGNASHIQATKDSAIDEISWTTWHVENYCGIFGRYTNVVYGIGKEADPTARSVADYE